MPKWGDFVTWVFFGLLAYFAYSITNNVDRMSDSVSELNKNVAVVVYQVTDLDERVDRLEGKK